jgi:hypothetical protein
MSQRAFAISPFAASMCACNDILWNLAKVLASARWPIFCKNTKDVCLENLYRRCCVLGWCVAGGEVPQRDSSSFDRSGGTRADKRSDHRDRCVSFGYHAAVDREDVLHARPDIKRPVNARYACGACQAYRVVEQRLVAPHYH